MKKLTLVGLLVGCQDTDCSYDFFTTIDEELFACQNIGTARYASEFWLNEHYGMYANKDFCDTTNNYCCFSLEDQCFITFDSELKDTND